MALVINGEHIDDGVVEQEFSEIKAHHERVGRVPCCERDDEFRTQAKDNIIARVLIGQKAAEKQPEPSSEEIEEAYQELLKEHGGEQNFFYNMGLMPDQLDIVKGNISSSLQVDHYLKTVCPVSEEPDENDLKEYFASHESDYMTAPQVRASHIFKSVRMAEDREDIFNELCDVRNQIMNGSDFDELAKVHTDKPHDEIDLGWFGRGELMDEFEVMTFSMEVGEISPVFTTHGSFHIAKVTERRPARLPEFDEVKESVAANYIQATRDEAIRLHVEEIKETSVIDELDETEQVD